MSRFNPKLWFIPLVLCTIVYLSTTPAVRPPGAVGPYLNGVFTAEAPGEVRYDVEDVFPGLGFQGPVRVLPFPDSAQGIVILGKRGQAWLADPVTQESREIMNISDRILNGWEGGSLGIAFHPQFATGGPREVFVFYRWKHDLGDFTEEGYNRLSRFQWDDEARAIDAASEEILLQQYDRKSWHAGGDMFFGPDGFLYLSLGDEGLHEQDWPASNQRLDRGLFGGVIRIDINNDPTRSHPIRRQPLPPAPPPAGWPGSFSTGYMIPNDNPWLDETGESLEEFAVMGTRSPHAMVWDEGTESIWLADVGSNYYEEINQAVIGDNLGWPWAEGPRAPGNYPRPDSVIGRETVPYVAYSHDLGTCVMGGGIYRGQRLPNLQHHYVFADWGANSLMAVPAEGTGREITTLIADITSLPHDFPPAAKLSGVYPQPNGDIYLTVMGSRMSAGPGKIYRLVRGAVIQEPPLRLSELGAFSDLTNLEAAPGIIPYRTNAALYSDGAAKRRWLVVPNDGTHDTAAEQITFRANDSWSFPEGTVFIKHFEMPASTQASASPLRLETRFFIMGPDDKGYGLTYRWNEAGTEAFLINDSEERDYNVFNGAGQVTDTKTWTFPSRAQCLTCHTNNANYVLGVNTHQLNGEHTYPATGQTFNQLAYLEMAGVLDTLTEDPVDLPQSYALTDESAPLELRVRSYFDANCASCHQPGGMEAVDMDLRFLTTDSLDRRIIGFATNSHASNPDYNIVEPGDHAVSEIWLRDAELGDNQMPPLGRSTVDELWTLRLAEWIDGLSPPEGGPEAAPDEVLVYPNPTAGSVTLQTPTDWAAPYLVKVYDVTGRLLLQAELEERGQVIDLSNCPSGILLLSIEDENGRREERKIVRL